MEGSGKPLLQHQGQITSRSKPGRVGRVSSDLSTKLLGMVENSEVAATVEEARGSAAAYRLMGFEPTNVSYYVHTFPRGTMDTVYFLNSIETGSWHSLDVRSNASRISHCNISCLDFLACVDVGKVEEHADGRA
jgi:hypothetical protein